MKLSANKTYGSVVSTMSWHWFVQNKKLMIVKYKYALRHRSAAEAAAFRRRVLLACDAFSVLCNREPFKDNAHV
jgi:hypothetical protein